ncbi:hypothetical protein DXT99_24835 [Pontibacter diazotrophicus]|uniref:Uncharacterized protein n=1 Tax=Pontibacter diazotrophicus TaxID=1400979 RepID=A0A3D8L2W0_9BACT|nr:hypothetical protein DXT99_24835 [Pontibacter diazotrophicus]
MLQMVFNGRAVSELARSLGIGEKTSFTAGKAATSPKKTKGKSKPCLQRKDVIIVEEIIIAFAIAVQQLRF